MRASARARVELRFFLKCADPGLAAMFGGALSFRSGQRSQSALALSRERLRGPLSPNPPIMKKSCLNITLKESNLVLGKRIARR